MHKACKYYSFDGYGGGMNANSPALQRLGKRFYLVDRQENKQLHTIDQLLTQVYQSGTSFALFHGSTAGNHLMLLSHCKPGDRVIIPRNIHKSIMAAVIMSGVRPVYVEPQYDPRLGLINNPSFAALEHSFLQNTGIRAVVITCPTYDGICANLEQLSGLARSRDAYLLVDEAHGPHFGFHPALPASALQQGADAVVQSAHKVLSSLSQTAMLHLRRGSALSGEVCDLRNWLMTSDVSPFLLRSFAGTMKQMKTRRRELWGGALERIELVREAIRSLDGLHCLEDQIHWGQHWESWTFDPGKITVTVDELGITGAEAAFYLDHEWRISVELYGPSSFLLMFSPSNSPEHIHRLIKALGGLRSLANPKRRTEWYAPELPKAGPSVMIPRDAYFAAKRLVTAKSAVDCICGEIVAPYPPGIPILMPGELVTAETIAFIEEVYRYKGIKEEFRLLIIE